MTAVRLTREQLHELELLATGVYGTPPRYRLPGTGDPIATLRVSSTAPADSLDLLDLENTPVARVDVEDRREDGSDTWISGPVTPLAEFAPALHHDLRPSETARWKDGKATLLPSHGTADDVPAKGRVILVDDGRPGNLARTLGTLLASGRDVRILPSPAAEHVPPERRTDLHLELARRAFGVDVDAADVDDRHAPGPGVVVLLTGLSGSGKSTIARALASRLEREHGRQVTLLDGDEVRRLLSSGLGYTREDRETNLRRVGWVASLVSSHGGIAICPAIAPYRSAREEIRAMAAAVGRFVLVFVSTPLDICEGRDRKGLYARARAGEIERFTGVSDPYEEPDDAEVVVDTSVIEVGQAVDAIVSAMGPLAP